MTARNKCNAADLSHAVSGVRCRWLNSSSAGGGASRGVGVPFAAKRRALHHRRALRVRADQRMMRDPEHWPRQARTESRMAS